MSIQLKINHKNGGQEVVNLSDSSMLPQVKGGHFYTEIEHQSQTANYELFDSATGAAPQQVVVKKQGNDLHVFLDEDDQVDLVIKDYYGEEESPLIGLGDDGQYYAYVAESGLEGEYIPLLNDGVLAAQVLGGDALLAAALPINWTPILYGLGGLLAAGLVAAAVGGSSSGSGSGSGSGHSQKPSNKIELGHEVVQDENGRDKLTGAEFVKPNPDANTTEIRYKDTDKPNNAKYDKLVVEKQADGSIAFDEKTQEFINSLPDNKKPTLVDTDGDGKLDTVKLPPELIKDGSKISVTDDLGGKETTAAAYDKTVSLEVTDVVGSRDVDGDKLKDIVDNNKDGKADEFTMVIKTEPGAIVTVEDKDGNVISGPIKADEDGVAKVPVSLDPTNPSRDELADLSVKAEKEGFNSDNLPLEEAKNKDALDSKLTDEAKQPADAASNVTPPAVTVDPQKPNTIDIARPDNSDGSDGKQSIDATVHLPKPEPTEDNQDPQTPPPINIHVDEKGNVTIDGQAVKPEDLTDSSKLPDPIKSIEVTDNEVKVTLEDDAPVGTNITSSTTDSNNNKSPESEPVGKTEEGGADKPDTYGPIDPNTLEKAKTPTITADSLKSQNLEGDANKTVEGLSFSGSGADAGANIEVYVVKKGTDTPILVSNTTKADANGDFKVIIDERNPTVNVDLEEGDQVYVVSKPANKQPSEPSSKAEVPAVPNGAEGHPNVHTDPVEPTITTKEKAGDGGATVDATGIKPGETLVIEAVKTGDTKENPTELKFTKDPETGKLTPHPDNDPEINVTIDGDKVTIDEKSLADDQPIKAHIENDAGKTSSESKSDVGHDEAAPQPEVKEVYPVDTDSKSDGEADAVAVVVKKPEAAEDGSVPNIVITDDLGNKLADVPAKAGDYPPAKVVDNGDGTLTVIAPNNPENTPPESVSVQLTEEGKDPSEPVTQNVGSEIPEGEKGHPNDQTGPEAPTVTQTDDAVKVKFDPEDTNELIIPTTDPNNPLVFTKQEDGSFASNNPNVPPIPAGKDSVELPRGDSSLFPKEAVDDFKVTAKDAAGNETESATSPIKPLNQEETAQPVIESVDSIDLSAQADPNPEKLVIKGSIPGAADNTELKVYKVLPDGNKVELDGVVGSVKDGKFEITVTESKDADGKTFVDSFNVGDNIIVEAKEPGKRANTSETKPVETATAHEGDHEAPAKAEVIDSADNATKFKVDPDVAEAEVTYTPKGSDQAVTETLKRDPETGKLTAPEGSPIVVGEDGNTFELPVDSTEPRTPVTVDVKDLAGNSPKDSNSLTPDTTQAVTKSPEDALPTPDTDATGEPTKAPTVDKITAVDTNKPADGTADKLIVEGTAEPNATVNINGVETKADDKGHFKAEVPVPEADKPLEIVATGEGDNRQPSDPVIRPLTDAEKQPTVFDDKLANEPIPQENLNRLDNGDVTVKLPSDLQPGEKAQITISGQPPVVVELIKNDGEGWTSPTHPELSTNTDLVTIPDALTPPNAEVSVTTTDLANNTSEPTSINAGKELSQPVTAKVESINTTDPHSDEPTEFKITGKAKPGAEVTAKDSEGNIIGTAVADQDGNYTIIAKENGVDIKAGNQITVEADDDGKNSAEDNYAPRKITVDVPAVAEGKDSHTGDKTPPSFEVPAAEVITEGDNKGGVKIPLPETSGENAPQKGDQVVAEIKDKDGNKVGEVVATYDPEKGWETTSPSGTITGQPPALEIDKDAISEGGSVSVVGKDELGNPTEATETQIPEVSTLVPEITKVTAIDKSAPTADDNPEAIVVEGNVPGYDHSKHAGSVVTVKVGDTTVTAPVDENGNFKVTITEPTGQNTLNVGDQVTAAVTEPGKEIGTTSAAKDVPAVADGQEGHTGDRTPPKAPVLSDATENAPKPAKAEADKDIKFTLDPETKEATFTVHPKDAAEPVEVKYTQQPDGSYKSDRPDILPNIPAPADNAKAELTIPAGTLKPNSVIETTATDLAGNPSQPNTIAVTEPKSADDLLTSEKVQKAELSKDEATDKVYLDLPNPDVDTASGTKRVVLSYQPEPVNGVEQARKEAIFTYENGAWKTTDPAFTGLNAVETKGKLRFTLEGTNFADGKDIIATATSANGAVKAEPSVVVAPITQLSQDPTQVTITPIDTTLPNADGGIETVRIAGEAPAGSIVALKDPKNPAKPIATVTADENGHFSFELPAETMIGDKELGQIVTVDAANVDANLKITATEPNKKESKPTPLADMQGYKVIQPVEYLDQTAPEAATLDPNSEKGIEVTPKADTVELEVKVLQPAAQAGGQPTEVPYTLVKDNNGKWTAKGSDKLPEGITQEGDKLVFTKDVLAPNAPAVQTVTAGLEITAKDIAGNPSAVEKEEVLLLGKPTVTELSGVDKNTVSDGNPDEITVKGTTPAGTPEGTDVVVMKGDVEVGRGKVKADGSFELTFNDGEGDKDVVAGDELKVVLEKPNAVSSSATNSTLTPENITSEESIPPKVESERTPEGTVTNTISPSDDVKEIEVKVGEETETWVKNEDPDTKDEKPFVPKDGNDNPNVDTTVKVEDGKVIVETNAGDKPVEVSATDNNGNTGKDTSTQEDAKPALETTADPTDIAVKAINTGTTRDGNPEEFVVTGKAEPNAQVDIFYDGKRIGTGTADKDGNFSVPASELDGMDIQAGGKLTVVATGTMEDGRSKNPSAATENATVEPVANTTDANPNAKAVDIVRPEESGAGDNSGSGEGTGSGEGSDNGENPTEPAEKPPVEIHLDDNAESAVVKVGDETVNITRDPETGKLISDNPDLVKPSEDPNKPNVFEVPADKAEGKDISVDVTNKDGSEDSATSPAPQPEEAVAPAKPDVNAKADGGLELDFPANAENGSKVVLVYQPEGEKGFSTLTFVKGEDGWTLEGENARLPEGAAIENGKLTIPADKVANPSPVEAWSVHKDGKVRSESDRTTLLSEPADATDEGNEPAAEPTATPAITEVKATDNNKDGNPDELLVKGNVPGAAEGTIVSVSFKDKPELGTFETTTDANGNFELTIPDTEGRDINVGDTLIAKAKDHDKPASEASAERPITAEDVVTPPAEEPKAPSVEIAPTEDGVKVTLGQPAKEGDKASVISTPAEEGNTAGQPSGTPKTDEYVYENGKWKPVDPTSPPVNEKGEIDLVLPPGSTVEVKTETANPENPNEPIVNEVPAETVPPRDVDGDGQPDAVPPTAETAEVKTTATPTDLKVVAKDMATQADGNPDHFIVTGKVAGEPIGTVVTVTDSQGNTYTGETTDAEGNFTIVFEDKDHDLVLGKDPLETLTVSAKAPNKKPSPVTDGTTLTLDNNVEMTYADDKAPEVPVVTANKDGSVSVKLPTDAVAGDKVSVKFTPTGADAPVDVVYEKQANGDWKVTPAGSENGLPTTVTESQPEFVIPATAVKDGSVVSVIAEDKAGNATPDPLAEIPEGQTDESAADRQKAKATAGTDKTTAPATSVTVKATDLSSKADLNPEKVEITGKVVGEPEGTTVALTDENGNPILDKDGNPITTKTDAEGNFTFVLVENGTPDNLKGENAVELPAGKDLAAGDEFRIVTEVKGIDGEANKPASDPVKAEIPAIDPTDASAHQGDNTDPTAPTLTPSPIEGNGSVTLGLPTDAVANDKVVVKFTPEATADNPNPTEQEVTLTKLPEGGWESSNPDLIPNVPKGQDSVVIPEDSLQDGTPVSAKTVDLAGKESQETVLDKAGNDEQATQPQEVNFTPLDKDGNGDIDAVNVTGKGKPGETIEVYDQDGNKVGEHKIPEDAAKDENGLADFDFEVAPKAPATAFEPDTTLSTKATDGNNNADKDPSASTEPQPIGQVEEGTPSEDALSKDEAAVSENKGGHPEDNTTPTAPTFDTAEKPAGDGSITLNLPTDVKVGDKVRVEFTDENGNPQVATLTKQADGWTSDNALIPNTAINGNTVTIPEESLQDGEPVKARTIDTAGNISARITSPNAGYDAVTTKPAAVTVQAFDTDSQSNNGIDAILVKGKTDPNATVTIKVGDEVLGTAVANDQGEFTALITKADVENVDKLKEKLGITDSDNVYPAGNQGKDAASLNPAAITLTAKHPEKAESPAIESEIPALTDGSTDHPFDQTSPEKATVTPNEGDKGVDVKLSDDADPETQADLNFTKPAKDGKPAEEVSVGYTKDPEGNGWTVKPEDAEKAKELGLPEKSADGNIHIPSESLEDGKPVTVDTTDPAGNSTSSVGEGEKPAVAPFEQETVLEDIKLVSYDNTNEQGIVSPSNPERMVITGKTDPGAKLTITLKTGDGENDVTTLEITAPTEPVTDGKVEFNITLDESQYPFNTGDSIQVGKDVTVTAELVGKKAATTAETQQVPNTRTVELQVEEVKALDGGKLGDDGRTLNPLESDDTIDEVKVTGKIEKDAKLVVKVYEGDVISDATLVASKEFAVDALNFSNENAAATNKNGDTITLGDFSVILGRDVLEQGKAYAAGNKVVVEAINVSTDGVHKATDTYKDGTLKALTDGQADHPYDKNPDQQDPAAPVNHVTDLKDSDITFSVVETGEHAGRQQASVKLPTRSDVKSFSLTFNNDNDADQAVTVTYERKDGKWVMDDASNANDKLAGLAKEIAVTESSLSIPHTLINGDGADADARGKVTMTLTDKTDQTASIEQAVVADIGTAVQITSVVAQDTSAAVSDLTAEQLKVTVVAEAGAKLDFTIGDQTYSHTVGETEGSEYTGNAINDQFGNPVAGLRTVEVTIPVTSAAYNGQALSVVATKEGKTAATTTHSDIGAVPNGEEGHPNDKTLSTTWTAANIEQQVEVTYNDAGKAAVNVTLPTDNDIRKVVLTFNSETAGKEVQAEYINTNAGTGNAPAWEAVTDKAFGTTVANGVVTIPAEEYKGAATATGKASVKLSAYDIAYNGVTDKGNAGNEPANDNLDTVGNSVEAADLTPSDSPTINTTVVTDLSKVGDNVPEKAVISGTTTAGATVYLYNEDGTPVMNNGQPVSTTAGQNGAFSFTLTSSDTPQADEIKVDSLKFDTTADYKVAVKSVDTDTTKYGLSDQVGVDVPTVPAGDQSTLHPNDRTPPTAEAAVAATGEAVEVKVPAAELKVGDVLTVADTTGNANNGDRVVGKWTWNGTAWDPVETPAEGVTAPVQKDGNWVVTVAPSADQTAQDKLAIGDTIKATISDYAGNEQTTAGTAEMPDPSKIDPIVIKAGSKIKGQAANDPSKDRLDVTSEPNSGDVYILLGGETKDGDHIKLKATYAKKDGATEADPVHEVWAHKLPSGEWTLSDSETAPTTAVTTLADKGASIITVDGTPYLKLAAEQLQDGDLVNVSAWDGVSTKVPTSPTDTSPRELPNVSIGSIRADFDDSTDNEVNAGTKPTITQQNANADIQISLPQDTDAKAMIITFSSAHLSDETAAQLGLNKGNNYLYAYKEPNGSWAVNVVNGNDVTTADFTKLNSGVGQPNTSVATVDASGAIVLKKVAVDGKGTTAGADGSTVSGKVLDAYHNTADLTAKTVEHSDPARPPMVATAPTVTSLGNGLISVVPARAEDDTNISEKTEIDLNKDGSVDFEIVWVPSTQSSPGHFELKQNGQTLTAPDAAKGIVSFDSDSGKLVLSGSNKAVLQATTVKADKLDTSNVDKASDEATFIVEDLSDNSADIALITANPDGSMSFEPGPDNVKLKVSYTDENGTTHTDVVLAKQSNGSWLAEDSARRGDFDGLKLKPGSVKDGTVVTVKGVDATTGDGKPNVSEAREANANVDDADTSATNAPSFSQDKATDPIVITRQDDHQSMSVEYTKGNTKYSIHTKLNSDGTWSLLDNSDTPVAKVIASVDSNGNISLQPGAVEQGQAIKATGFDASGNSKEGTATPKAASVDYGDQTGGVNEGGTEVPLYKVTSLNDASFTVERSTRATSGNLAQNEMIIEFKVWNVKRGVEGTAYVYMQTQGGNYPETTASYLSRPFGTDLQYNYGGVIFKWNGSDTPEPISNRDYERGKGLLDGFLMWDDSAAPFNGGFEQAGKLTVKSTDAYKLIADSLGQPSEDNQFDEKLMVKIYSTHKRTHPVLKGGFDETADPSTWGDPVLVGYLKNEDVNTSTGGSLPGVTTDTTPKVTFEELTDGSVIIKPSDDTNRMKVTYIGDNYSVNSAILVKNAQGKWEVQPKSAESDFDLSGSNPKLLGESVRDKEKDAVVVDAMSDGKQNSGNAYHETKESKKPVPPQPEATYEQGKGIDDYVNDARAKGSFGGKGDFGLTGNIDPRFRENGGKETINKIRDGFAKEGYIFGNVLENQKVQNNTHDGYKINFHDFSDAEHAEFNNNTLALKGSIASGSFWEIGNYRPVEVNMGKGNDYLILSDLLGDLDNLAQGYKVRHHVDMGEGHDVILVGGSQPWVNLYENLNELYDPAKRFTMTRGTPADGTLVTSVNEGNGNAGGRITAFNVDTGDGNDALLIEGLDGGHAIGHSHINMGAGNDLLLTGYDDKLGGVNQSNIAMGSGNDTAKLGLVEGNSVIKMEDGNDKLELNILNGDSRVDMGSGDDFLFLKSALYQGTHVFLGDGNDTMVFGGKFSSAWDGARMDGVIEGGSGYDVLALQTPLSQPNNRNKHNTHLMTKNMKGIEEVWLDHGTAIDIRLQDLRNDGMSGPLKIRAISTDNDGNAKAYGKTSGTKGSNTSVIDFGDNNWNRYDDTANLKDGGGKWQKVGQTTDANVTYDIYRHGYDNTQDVWIEHDAIINHHFVII